MATAAKKTESKPAAATQVTFLEAIKQAMYEEMERDPAVVLIGEDIGVYGGAFKTSEGLLGRFGWERVIDTPITESAIVGAACGMSYLGLRPIAEMQFIDFIVCAFNQITNFVAKGHYLWNAPAPIVIRGPCWRRRARRTVPLRQSGNVFRAHARSEGDLSFDAVRRQGPAQGRGARQQSGAFLRAQVPVPPHQGRTPRRGLHRADRQSRRAPRRHGHLTIISYAAMMHTSLEAAADLAKEGIEAEVIDLRTLSATR